MRYIIKVSIGTFSTTFATVKSRLELLPVLRMVCRDYDSRFTVSVLVQTEKNYLTGVVQ
jgi:hypothetical protein